MRAIYVAALMAAGVVSAIHSVSAQEASEQGALAAESRAADTKDILNLDIEQLGKVNVLSPAMNVEVSTVNRHQGTVGRSPAAVYVVSNEMIRRIGARNVPEVLRTVPGVNVARINASAWAISIRGFDARFSNKLLVQVDGVAIYSPTHSGVFWEREYVMLEDVERIEVIRGPGASVWGVNAVNGIINIITKSSKDTKGVYVDAGVGDPHGHRQFADFHVGGQSGQNGDLHWRVYGMTVNDGQSYIPSPKVIDDGLDLNQGGFRTDWTPTGQDTITLQGDFYGGVDNQVGVYTPPATSSPMYCNTTRFMTRWSRKIDDETDWALQLYYYDPYARGSNLNNVSTFDADFQYHLKRGRHDIIWGLGYRNYDERWAVGSTTSSYDSEQIPSYFIQDTYTLVEDRFFLTLGSKFDHDDVTTFQFQPTARVLWTPDERTSIWGAISRAARTPSLMERTTITPRAEDLMAYEAGIRRQPNEKLFWDLAAFYNRYSDLLGVNSRFVYGNAGKATTYGGEISANYTMSERWRLTGSYSFIIEEFVWEPGYALSAPEGTPRNQLYFQSSWDLGHDVSLDMMFRYVDTIPAGVPSYFAADVRTAWQATKHVELSVVGQNLFAGKHYEFLSSRAANPTEIGPSVYGMVTWRH